MRGRGLLIALICSLAANLFLVSAGASIYLFGRHAPQASSAGGAMKHAVAALPAPDRKPFIAMLRASGARVRPDNRRARALRETAWSALAEGTETADAIKQQLAEARALNQTSRTTVENAVVDYSVALDPAGRQAVGLTLRPSSLSRKPL